MRAGQLGITWRSASRRFRRRTNSADVALTRNEPVPRSIAVSYALTRESPALLRGRRGIRSELVETDMVQWAVGCSSCSRSCR